MGIKRYIVREGFHFRQIVPTEKGTVEKIYSEGDIVSLDEAEGGAAHQLELADENDRAAAAKAEAKARKASTEATPSAAFDQEAFAAAIAAGVAQALAANAAQA